MFAQDTINEITDAAREAKLEPAALLAVAELESGGRAFAIVDGRKEPPIRFEGHYFDARLSPDDRAKARAEGLASPQAGAVANPASQTGRWRLLERAAQIDRKAAFESASWGLGQVMGAHWAWLGYANVDALVAEARSGAAGQARLMARYIADAGLAAPLRAHDWAGFARGYNGPAFRRNGYDSKLAAAFARYAGGTSLAGASAAASPLKRGDHGAVVRDLQISLSALGYPLPADGVFGPATEAALRRFQADRHIAVDGLAGNETCKALRQAMPIGNWFTALWHGIVALLPSWLHGGR